VVQEWGDSIEIKRNNPGIHNLQVQQRSAYGCLSPPVYARVLVSKPQIDLGNNISLCAGKTTTIDAGSGFTTYNWSNGVNSREIEVGNAGWYKVMAYDESGCIASDSVYVTTIQNPEVNLGLDTTLCWTETIELDAGTNGENYLWFDNSRNRYFTAYAGLSTVWVSVTNTWGCTGSDTLLIKVCDYSKFASTIPNTFTPNGDGKNDSWYIPWLFRLDTDVRIDVYDRWGQMVYHSDNGLPANGWDGTRNGKKLPMDSYYYVIDLRNGSSVITGTVTIVR
jgi:gliding motility-associated-like protein